MLSFFVTSFSSFFLFSFTSYYFHSSSTSSLFLFFSFLHSSLSHLHFIIRWYLHLAPPLLQFFLYLLQILPLRILLLWLFFFLVLLRPQLFQLALSGFYLFSISNLPLWLIVLFLFGSSPSTSTYECFGVILLCLLSWISLYRSFCRDKLASEQTASSKNIVHSLASQYFTRTNAKRLRTSEQRNSICWRLVCKSLTNPSALPSVAPRNRQTRSLKLSSLCLLKSKVFFWLIL